MRVDGIVRRAAALCARGFDVYNMSSALKRSSMPSVDELMRRFEDLSKRAADLRSYL